MHEYSNKEGSAKGKKNHQQLGYPPAAKHAANPKLEGALAALELWCAVE